MIEPRSGRRRVLALLVPAGLVVVCVGFAVWLLRPDDTRVVEPVDIRAAGVRFDDLDALAAGSDFVVDGVVLAVDDGRALTDPSDPDAGITTQLAQVEVLGEVAGDAPGPLVVEQEAALLDGTPIRVNGVTPLAVGDRGLFFLVQGDGEDFPYTAFVNEQGWVPIVDGRVVPIDGEDPVWSGVSDGVVTEVVAAISD